MEAAVNLTLAAIRSGPATIKAVLAKFGLKQVKSTFLTRLLGRITPFVANAGRTVANLMNSDGDGYIEIHFVEFYDTNNKSASYSNYFYTR